MSSVLVQTRDVASANAREVGRLMREAREASRLTQQQVADRIGVTSTQVSRWERGTADPRMENLEAYAEVTRTPLRHFFPRPQPAEGATLEEMLFELLQMTSRVAEAVERLADRPDESENSGGRSRPS